MGVIAAVVFDFDGTLVDSANLKRDGYRAGLAAVGVADTPQAWSAYGRHRFSNRRILLASCFTDLTGAEPSAEEMDELVRGYTHHVTTHAEEVRVFPGVSRFVKRAGARPLYVASNAPMDEIGTTCARLGLSRYFTRIYGHPVTKESAIRRVAERVAADLSAIVYVGDHPGDQRLAASLGTRFVHLDPTGEFVEDVAEVSLRSLDELGDHLFGADK